MFALLDPIWFMFSAWVSLLISLYALRKKSLSNSGAVAAWVVGFFTTAAGLRFFASLMFFFASSSILTKFGADVKKKLDEDYTHSSQRTAVQVFSNGLAGTLASLMYQAISPERAVCLDSKSQTMLTFLACAFVGHYACCNGDTWASELGILSKSPPILITSFKKVAPGTNGALSGLGLFASFAGGLSVGLIYFITSLFTVSSFNCPTQLPIIFIGFFGGGFGSLVDSLLGATLQTSYFNEETKCVTNEPGQNRKVICGKPILDNHQVNLISSVITAITCGILSLWLF